MKFRTDFVTNSSSSSFVLGQYDDNTTVDDVYQLLKDLYVKHNKTRDALIEAGKDMGFTFAKGTVAIVEDGNIIDYTAGPSYWEKRRRIAEAVQRTYNVDICDFTAPISYPTWMQMQTYKEYEDYWLAEYAKDKHGSAPFAIVDLTQKGAQIYDLTCYTCAENKATVDEIAIDTLGWYFPCQDSDNPEEECSWCPTQKEECLKMKAALKEGKSDNIPALLLGKICIISECGYIPFSIVKELADISNFACNHMG